MIRMPSRIIVLASTIGLFTAASVRADLAHGFIQLAGVSFDFSTQIAYPGPPTDYPGDISSVIFTEPRLGPQLITWWEAGILFVPDMAVENIEVAPTDPNAYREMEAPEVGRAYVFRTGDGFYAKFAVREWYPGSTIIEYYVQIDGTNNLDDTIAVEPTTWGRVKALYR